MSLVLEVNDAHKRFGDTRALDGATLELRRGERLGLLGPNGAGKSTLVRAVAGRVRLDRGTITLLGDAMDGPRAGRGQCRRLGVIPQEVALHGRLSAKENLQAFGALLGLRGADLERQVDWALDWSGLEERADEPAEDFSGGMRRRLNIACSVLHRPEVLLLDEPTVGVDPQSRERIWDMLEDLRKGGTSQLLTTHQLDEAQRICQRIVIIDAGRVVAAGTFAELLESTIGADQRVTCTLEGDVPQGLEALGFHSVDAASLSFPVKDVARELPERLAALTARGARVSDLRIEAPDLQAVFIHLTGRELRE